MTVTQALSEAARRHADRAAVLGGGVSLTHAGLELCVAQAAADLAALGVAPGDLVGVSMASSPLHLVTLLALARAGACSVHLHPQIARPARDAIAAQFGVTKRIGDPGMRTPLLANPSWLEPRAGAGGADRSTPDAPWRLAMSSGTTGLQKAILYPHGQTLDYLKLHDRVVPMSPGERYLCHRGLDSNLALNTVLCHLRAGGAVVFPESLVLQHFIEAVDRHAVTQLTLSPAFLRNLVDAVPEKGLRFPGLRLVRVAGSSLPPSLLEAALERLTPNLASVYGLFEIGFVTFGGAADLRRVPESVGKVVAGVEAELTDEGGAPVAAGTPGLLRLRRAGMPQAYFRNPEATAKAFRGGWFHTGDYARLDAEGMLHIGGRADDKMNLDGQKIEPGPIEQALETHPAVAEAAVFAAAPRGKARLYAAVVRRAPVDEQALLAHCRGRVGEPYTPKQVFFLERLPRNEAGKLLRGELSRRVKRPAG